MGKIKNIKNHIKEKQFGSAVIRAMSAAFQMDIDIIEKNNESTVA